MSHSIYQKMSAVMKDIGHVSKDQKNEQQKYMFRGIDQFTNALYPALVKHGVFMIPRVTRYSHEIKEVMRSSGKPGLDKHVAILMEYDFYSADDGSKITMGPMPAEGVDSGDKATNKALSAALKYGLWQTFTITTEDTEEADKSSPEDNMGFNSNLAANRMVQNKPYAQVASKGSGPSGVKCRLCGEELRLAKAGTSYYCPNWKDGRGTHQSLGVAQLEAERERQAVEMAVMSDGDAMLGGAPWDV